MCSPTDSITAARSATGRLMSEVDNLITLCANEMWSHWSNTNMAFQQRVTETNDTHNKLQSHLSKTMQEIYDQESDSHIDIVKAAVVVDKLYHKLRPVH